MLDQLAGRPSPSWRRSQVRLPRPPLPLFVATLALASHADTEHGTQVLFFLIFWLSRLALGPRTPPRLFWLRRLNKLLSRFSPWQLILSTLTIVYAVRHADVLLGLQAPEPLARLYSRDYYRATWIVTALDAGFATAMGIRWKWLRDVASLAFSGYYLLFAHEADEKLRKYRAFCTVEMLRTTWEKQSNPIIRFVTARHRPFIKVRRKIFLPRPEGSKYSKPITAHLFFYGTELELAAQHELVMDLPGGGFICMNPEHHEERLLRWARQTKRPVLSFDYGKAPEYPFPFAIDEMYDAYSLLHAMKGKCVGMNLAGEKELRVVLTGDSAGANIATAMVVKILETRPTPASPASRKPTSLPVTHAPGSSASAHLPLPVALIFAYPALSFHFTSWMPSTDLRVLRSESHPDVASILRGKEHHDHKAPLSVVEDVERRSAGSERGRPKVLRRKRTTSWGRGLVPGLPSSVSFAALRGAEEGTVNRPGEAGDTEEEEVPVTDEREKSLSERVLWWDAGDAERQKELKELAVREAERVRGEMENGKGKGGVGETRLAMTSRTAFFNDRIISPSMCRAMALLYIGPRHAPDLHSDYHISPIFTPPHLLAQFPPLYMSCGERDPFVDDTVIFAGKLREAKEARKLELLARDSRHGESLRMSGAASSSRPALLDESEDDWVHTSIIAGWSHGYLQMVSLLPAAEKVIAMMGEWIIEAFDKAEPKQQSGKKPGGRPSPVVSPGASFQRVPTPRPAASPASAFRPAKIKPPSADTPGPLSGFLTPSPDQPATPQPPSESDKEDEILTFTPKRRRDSSNASRAGSPSPVFLAQPGPALPSSSLPVPGKVLSGDRASGASSASTTQPRTPEDTASSSPPPLSPLRSPGYLINPAERALRNELATLPLSSKATPASTSAASATRVPGAQRYFLTSPPTTPLDRPASAVPASYLDAAHPHSPRPSPLARQRSGKSRSGSAESLPPPTGAIFVDAKDLLRRRRDDVVLGLSSTAGSAKASRATSPTGGGRAESSSRAQEAAAEEDGNGAPFERRKTTPV
ncbi:hypothetical protein JCM10213_009137 [Rhodosporidiobolus nylandii]